ncbi:MAG: glycosyltransferase family 4 protein [Actinomycetota bacterium]|nr:glycosyltransferase family 4 protein [Actinomycetota bacterium]
MILWISTATSYGGAEHYLATIVAELADRFRFTVVVGDRAPAVAQARFEEAGADVEHVAGLGRHPSVRATSALAGILSAVDPALVHVNLTDQGDALMPLVVARALRRPLVATLHNTVPDRSGPRELLSRWSLRLPHRVIAVSDDGGRYPRDAGAAVRVVRNGIRPPAPVPDARVRLGSGTDRFVVCGVGRLHHQKGWDVLCRAAPMVLRSCPAADLVVVGEGDEREALESMPGSEHVRFLGFRPDAASLVAGADLLVLPSRYEAFGFVLVEAMLAGVPVVASRVGAVCEVVGDDAVLVAPERPDELAAAIVALATDPDRRQDLAARGRRRAQELFGAERMATQTAAMYRDLLG